MDQRTEGADRTFPLPICNLYYNYNLLHELFKAIDCYVKKFILYILNPDNPEFLENDNNKTEQSIQTIKAYKNLSDCVKPDNIKLLETFIETHIPDIHNIFIDYIYKLLLSNYGV